jgi:hypothetical protein
MHARFPFRAGLLAVLAWGWCAGAPAQGPTVWQNEIVDSEGVPGIYHALAVDAAGRPHLVYLKSSRHELWYARWTGSAWVKTKITDVAPSGMVRALTVSMAMDGAGTPHVAFFENGTGKLRYAKRTPTGWQVQSVAGGGVMVAGEYNSIAVDGAGRPHILYSTFNTDTFNDSVRCVYWTGSAWQYLVVSSSTESDCDRADISIAVDRNGTLHALYFCYDSTVRIGGKTPKSLVRHATWGGGVPFSRWTIDYTLTDYYWGGELALDRSGNPHAAYTLNRWNAMPDLRYTRRGAGWSAPATLATGVSYETAFLLNNGSQPCVTYADLDGRQLFGWHGGPAWATATVQPPAGAGSGAARLAKGPDGRIFLSSYYIHYDAAQNINRAELRLAQTAPGLWFGAVDVGGGWKWLDWFGYYTDAQAPWIFHQQHGWLYPFGTSTEAVTFWDANRGVFWWTRHSRYPYLYRFTQPGCWMWYKRGSKAPRVFLNCATGQWEPW